MSNIIVGHLEYFINELSKEGYSIVKTGVKTFYKVSTEVATDVIKDYMNTRFEIRLEDFAYEQEQLTKEQKEIFYKNIDEKQLNFLFELLENTRISTYDMHAKILAKLYVKLIINGGFNYYESSLLANIKALTDQDFIYLYELLKDKSESPLYTNDSCEVSAINKFIQAGILSVNSHQVIGATEDYDYSVNFMLNDFSKELLEILKLIINE